MDGLNDFDLGPLTWVRGEIDVACNAVRAALDGWNGEDLTPLRGAATYLHQVAGALQIVDLQGVHQVTSAIEGLLADMQAKPELRRPASAVLAGRAVRALQAYLDGLMAGGANAELALMPIYTELVVERGGEAPAPSELFFPDTGLRARRALPEQVLDEAERGKALRHVRGKYQKGLLFYLQNKDAATGLALMAEAARDLEPLVPGPAQYTFWWAVGGMLEALAANEAAPDPWTKRMLGRLDLQMRRLAEGSRQLADSLFRDLLYCLLLDRSASGRAAEVRALFELDRYIPAAWAGADEQRAEALRPFLARLREALAAAKEHWLRLCAGGKENLEPLRAGAQQIQDAAAAVDDGLGTLAQAIRQAVFEHADEAAQNEALQVEMATAMLLLQHGAENYFKLGRDFPAHARTQAGRLRAAVSGTEPLDAFPGTPMLDEIARQAQERLLLAQVSREIQANLNQIEEILDKFFRNHQERGDLPLVPSLLKQVQGALSILQLDAAVDLVKAVADRVGLITQTADAILAEDLNWIAEAISSLGLYVEALRNGRDDPGRLRALLQPAAAAEPTEASVEEGLAEVTEKLVDAVGRLDAETDQGALLDEIRADIKRIIQDADLVGDAGLRGQAEAVRGLLDVHAPGTQICAAVQALAGVAPAAEAAAPAPPSQREVDAELLEIYIDEAQIVLAEMAVRLARLRDASQMPEDFVDIRRGFHTLKGSGRMVGLDDLAEVAWQAEQTLNLWLREERAVNAAILDFVALAEAGFRRWVAELEATGAVRNLDAEAVVALAHSLRGEPAAPAVVTPAVPPEAAPEPAPEAAVAQPELVHLGEHGVPAQLFVIFADEAAQRLADLRRHLADLAASADASIWEAFERAAHTLAGIARTTGLTPLAEAAHALENWAAAWPERARPLAEATRAGVAGVLDLLDDGLAQIARREWPCFPADLADRLSALRASEVPAEAGIAASAEELFAALLAEPEPPAPAAAPVAAPSVAMPAPVQAGAPEPGMEACDAQLLPIFLAEADELLPRIAEALGGWRAEPADPNHGQALQRALHTLKGGARMAGAMGLGDATHALETRLVELADAAPDAAFLDDFEQACDALAERIDRLRQPAQTSASETPAALPAVAPAETAAGVGQPIRAKADALDALLNEAGEISIARSRIESAMYHYRQTAQELTANVERLRGQLRELEIEAETQIGARLAKVDEGHFDPLEFDRYTRLQELTRLMAESVNDVSTAQENLLGGLGEVDAALLQQSRTTRSLQQELMHIRMVRLNSQAERLHRIVRQAAKETGRKARLVIEGGDTELDRGVLDKAMVPFEHLLRNAVVHGIEAPEARLALGKPETGEIRLTAHQDGTEVVLVLGDDGTGIDLDKVRARAEAMGWLERGEAVERERLESFLFMPGFTTVDTVTQMAGRGVGLDVVRSEIAGVGGRIRVESESGRGSRFSIRLPTNLAVAQAVLVRAGDQVYAVPAGMVVLVREVRETEWHGLVQAGATELDGQTYPLRSLAELTGQLPQPVEGRQRTVLLLRSGDERVALRVDTLQGNAEVVVKAIGPQLARVPGVAGATVLADGRVALILNPFALMERAPAAAAAVVEAARTEAMLPLVLVVDDSLTVRKITGRLLHREGYRVATAKDGVEALEHLQDELPAMMLLDIEMPRMDGFEVARHVRADPRTKGLPIIMITSRTADKHRDHALELGVNQYMGKPYQEAELLAAIAALLAR